MFDWLHNGSHILSIVAYIPLVGVLFILVAMRGGNNSSIKKVATGIALLDFLVSLPLWFAFDRNGDLFQFRESHSWIDSLGVRY